MVKSLFKNRKRSGMVLTDVVLSSGVVSAVNQGVVGANNILENLNSPGANGAFRNLAGEGVKNSDGTVVNIIKNHWFWVSLVLGTLAIATFFHYVTNKYKIKVVRAYDPTVSRAESFEIFAPPKKEILILTNDKNNSFSLSAYQNGYAPMSRDDFEKNLSIIERKFGKNKNKNSKSKGAAGTEVGPIRNKNVPVIIDTINKNIAAGYSKPLETKKNKIINKEEYKKIVRFIEGKISNFEIKEKLRFQKEEEERKIENQDYEHLNCFLCDNMATLGLTSTEFVMKPDDFKGLLGEKSLKEFDNFLGSIDSLGKKNEVEAIKFYIDRIDNSNSKWNYRVKKCMYLNGEEKCVEGCFSSKCCGSIEGMVDRFNYFSKKCCEINEWNDMLQLSYDKKASNDKRIKLDRINKEGKVTKSGFLYDIVSNGSYLKNEDFAIVNQNNKGVFEKVFFMGASFEKRGVNKKIGEDFSELIGGCFSEEGEAITVRIKKSELRKILNPRRKYYVEKALDNINGDDVKVNLLFSSSEYLNIEICSKEHFEKFSTIYSTTDMQKVKELVEWIKNNRIKDEDNIDNIDVSVEQESA